MRRVILVHFAGIVVMWLVLDAAVSLYKHDWYTSGYWLTEAGKAIALGVWMAAIGVYAEHRKRVKAGNPDGDRPG